MMMWPRIVAQVVLAVSRPFTGYRAALRWRRPINLTGLPGPWPLPLVEGDYYRNGTGKGWTELGWHGWRQRPTEPLQ